MLIQEKEPAEELMLRGHLPTPHSHTGHWRPRRGPVLWSRSAWHTRGVALGQTDLLLWAPALLCVK